MRDEEVLVLDKSRGIHLDYLRTDFYDFSDPEESYGKPDLDNNEWEVYGWTNSPYDPSASYQNRQVFFLKPSDLGGYDFSLEDCQVDAYPDRAVDAHNIESYSGDYVSEPTPTFGNSINYRLRNIPDRVHSSEDNIEFSDAECRGFSVELYTSDGELKKRLNLDRDFATYTLIKMERSIDGFEIPSTIKSHFVSSHI